jgi:hypothetical protein
MFYFALHGTFAGNAAGFALGYAVISSSALFSG